MKLHQNPEKLLSDYISEFSDANFYLKFSYHEMRALPSQMVILEDREKELIANVASKFNPRSEEEVSEILLNHGTISGWCKDYCEMNGPSLNRALIYDTLEDQFNCYSDPETCIKKCMSLIQYNRSHKNRQEIQKQFKPLSEEVDYYHNHLLIARETVKAIMLKGAHTLSYRNLKTNIQGLDLNDELSICQLDEFSFAWENNTH